MSLEVEALLERINEKHGSSYTRLKEKQIAAIQLCKSHHVLAILPTGYGKTVIVQALPYLDPNHETCVVIANPLNVIIDEQRQRFGDRCVVVDEDLIRELESSHATETLPAAETERSPDADSPLDLSKPTAQLSPSAQALQKLKDGNVNFILGHPEHLLHRSMKQLFMQGALSDKISHIIVDEAHVIISWGKSDFRPAYLKLGILRTILPSARVLALTATAPVNAQKEIKQALHITDASIVWESPDRPNVFLEVDGRLPSTGGDNTVEDAYDSVMDPILKQLAYDGSSFPKTIVYLPLKWCGHTHYLAVSGPLKNHPEEVTIQSADNEELSCLISQYHAPQSKGMKERITKAMKNPSGKLRLLLASEAYGMGADAPDVRHIIHIGPPNTIERYIQELGRCGRDGAPAKGTLYFNNNDIGANVDHLHDSMREYCKLKSCRRRKLLEYFSCTLPEVTDLHNCCDNCRKKCSCTVCSALPVASKKGKNLTTAKMTACAQQMLKYYFLAENNLIRDTTLFPSAVTALSDDLAEKLSADVIRFADRRHLKKACPVLIPRQIDNIISILEKVKQSC